MLAHLRQLVARIRHGLTNNPPLNPNIRVTFFRRPAKARKNMRASLRLNVDNLATCKRCQLAQNPGTHRFDLDRFATCSSHFYL